MFMYWENIYAYYIMYIYMLGCCWQSLKKHLKDTTAITLINTTKNSVNARNTFSKQVLKQLFALHFYFQFAISKHEFNEAEIIIT